MRPTSQAALRPAIMFVIAALVGSKAASRSIYFEKSAVGLTVKPDLDTYLNLNMPRGFSCQKMFTEV